MTSLGTLSFQNQTLQADIQRLKTGVDVSKVLKAAENDGLDQVFVKAQDQIYVLQGQGLSLDKLEKAFQADKAPAVQLKLADSLVEGEVIGVNNESNTAQEGMKKVAVAALLTGAVGLAPAAASLGVDMVTDSLPVIGGLGGTALGLGVGVQTGDIRAIIASPLAGGLIGNKLGKNLANVIYDFSGTKQMQKFNLIAGVAGIATAGLIVAGGAAWGAHRSVKADALKEYLH